MQDSFSSPPWGQPSFDEHDLDSLLAGGTDVPDALRPVAETLSALRSAPSPMELRSEAYIRAKFRQPRIEVPAMRAPVRRRTGGWFAGMMTAAAVIVLVAAIAYSGHLPGPVQRLAHETIAAPSGHQATGGVSPSVQSKSAQPAPSGSRQATSGAPSAAASPTAHRASLCNSFWAAMQQPRSGQKSWQTPLYDELSEAAGGPQHVYAYCYPVWNQKFARQYPQLPSFPPYFPKHWNYNGAGNYDNQQGGGATGNADHSSTGTGTGPDGGSGNSSLNINVAPTTSTGGTGISPATPISLAPTIGSANPLQQNSNR